MKAPDVMMNFGFAGTTKASAKLSSDIRQIQPTKSVQMKDGANSFERTLDDAQRGRAQDAKANPKDTAGNPADKTDTKNVKDDVKDTAKATDEAAKKAAAATQDAPKANAKDKAAKSDVTKDAGIEEDVEAVKATTLDAMLVSLAGAAAVEETVVTDTAEAKALPDLAQTAMKFEMLLPQTPDDADKAAQNARLMDMLGSLRTMTATDLKAAPELTELAKQALAAQQNMAGDAQTETPASIVQPGTAAGLGDVMATAVNDSVQAGKPQVLFAETLAQTAMQPQVVPSETDDTAKGQSALESLFGTAQVSVEETIAMPNADNTAQQQLSDALKEEAEATVSSGDAKLTQGNQLPENADFDVATRPSDPAPQQPLAGVQHLMTMQTPAQSAAVQAAEQQPVQDPYHVMQQIVDQARLIRSGADTEMVIKLNPQHLGELTLRVSVTAEGAVNASFHTDNPQVRGLIESSMVQLRQELQAQGIKVNNVEVYSGLSGDFFAGSQAGQQGFAQQGSQNAQPASIRAAAFEEDAEALSVSTVAPSADEAAAPFGVTTGGVDYKV